MKGTVHWVSTRHAIEAQVRLYGPLFNESNPGSARHEGSLAERLSADSLTILDGCKLEPFLGQANLEQRFQFERQGYFCLDSKHSSTRRPVFNRTVALRDSWARQARSK